MEHENRHIPNRLRKHRMLMGYKQKDVAYLLGLVSSNRISEWESGVSMPNVRNLIKLSVIYRTIPTELYFDVMLRMRDELKIKEHKLLTDIN
jgi:transcriptional regulator with XRE-family HTH domain